MIVGQQPAGMVLIRGRAASMGSDHFYPEERPVHSVTFGDFLIDRHLVTNHQFAAFVAETDHVTVAEQPLDRADYPDALPELLRPGGLVFAPPQQRVPLDDFTQWWSYVPGASWRTPHGPGSDLAGLDDHPVVQVGYHDAAAYAEWRGARLPSEVEWEFAARGGLESAAFCWGDDPDLDGLPMANTWQGEFPWQNLGLDGYEGTSPVGAFPANGYGLFDMAGNAWEWTSDWWQDHHALTSSCCGPSVERRTAPDSAAPGERYGRKVIKGGSHLCAPNYCLRFRPAARQPEALDTTTCHIGFRCAADA